MRQIGTLIPLASLRSSRPGLEREPCGTFATGEEFLGWLSRTGQTLWQMLPLGETHFEPGSRSVRVPSPYRGYGTGIDPRFIPEADTLARPDAASLDAFRRTHGEWLADHALFCAIRDAVGTDDWRTWEPGLRDREPKAIAAWTATHREAVEEHEVVQWRAHRAHARMRAKAVAAGIGLGGDLPFYLPVQSPLVWTHRGAFEIAPDGSLPRVSGVPESPDSHFGRQVWGHPLYRWERYEEVMGLWRLRVRHAAELYDMARIDHAKGFYRFGALDARGGSDAYVEGPGSRALDEVLHAAQDHGLTPFVEDSGMHVHPELHALLERRGVPGIRILRFAYNERSGKFSEDHADIRHYPGNSVAFTSTHDTLPLMGYLELLSFARRMSLALRTRVPFHQDVKVFARGLRDAAVRSPAARILVPLQDWLLIPDRINVPGTETPTGDRNWRWRMPMPIEDLPTDLGIPGARDSVVK